MSSFLKRGFIFLFVLQFFSFPFFEQRKSDVVSFGSVESFDHEECSPYLFRDALNDCGIPIDSRFTGQGIKIGFIDGGIPTGMDTFSNNIVHVNGTTEIEHATIVPSIASGKNGVAPLSELFFVEAQNADGIIQKINYLVSNHVNIINIAVGIQSMMTGRYSKLSNFIDHIIETENITIICSPGNGGKMSVPSLSLNAISIGATRQNKSIVHFFSETVGEDYESILDGPDLYAPGFDLYGIPGVNENPTNKGQLLQGTSYSAPIVTGICALLMQEFPELKQNAALLKNVLVSSSLHSTNEQNNTGIVNYQNARKSLQNSNLVQSVTGSSSIPICQSRSIWVKHGSSINISVFSSFELYLTTSGSIYTVISPNEIAYSQYRIDVSNSSGEIVKTSFSKGNLFCLTYTNELDDSFFTYNVYQLEYRSGSSPTTIISDYLSYDFYDINLSIIENNYLDTCPTFYWYSIYNDITLSEEYYDIVVCDRVGKTIVEIDNIVSTRLTFSKSQWKSIIDAPYRYYYVEIICHSLLYSLFTRSVVKKFEEPRTFQHFLQIKPSDYPFEPQYFYTEKEKSINVFPDFPIQTKRLRCGYIEKQMLNLSPRRQDAGYSYLELTFNRPAYQILVGISVWREYELLLMNSSVIKVLNQDREWEVKYDLFAHESELLIDRFRVVRVLFTSEQGFYGIRFEASADAFGNTNNGRICIDDIVFALNQNDDLQELHYERIV